MTSIYCLLLDCRQITEDYVEEPVEIALDLDLVACPSETVEEPTAGGVPPSYGGMTPLQVVDLFATRVPFEMGGLTIVHAHGHRGWWRLVQLLRSLTVSLMLVRANKCLALPRTFSLPTLHRALLLGSRLHRPQQRNCDDVQPAYVRTYVPPPVSPSSSPLAPYHTHHLYRHLFIIASTAVHLDE